MIAVLIEFRVLPGQDEAFRAAWTATTEHIRANFGSLGSRLHRAGPGRYIGYAQWPDRATYEREQVWDAAGSAVRKRMHDTLEGGRAQVVEILEVDVDRLASGRIAPSD